MTFTILHSNRVEKLRDALIDVMTDQPLGDPLAQECVLVDNRVLGEWVNLQLAQQRGIAANIRYLQAHELFWWLARSLVSANIPKQTPLSKEEMTWKLYAALGDTALLEAAEMEPVRHYLQGEESRERKHYQLAASVADLFDQYLIYRPDWIEAWSANKAARSGREDAQELWQSSEGWQRFLWQQLCIGSDLHSSLQHRASIEKSLKQILHSGELARSGELSQQIPLRRLFVFGMTSMPPHLLDLLMLLGKYCDVNLLVLNPCQHDWFGIRREKDLAKYLVRHLPEVKSLDEQHYEIGNPLLASQGVQVKEFVASIYQRMDQYDMEDGDAFEDPGAESLLACIQQEILNLEYQGVTAVMAAEKKLPPKHPLPSCEIKAGAIPSVHIHNCHSAMREVEVLHDQLRHIMAQHPDIQPRDIVVMMPQVAPYVPCIHAVFNSVASEQRLPYHITDRSRVDESPLLNSLVTLLQLPDSRLPLSEVLSLLEVPAVQRRFVFDQHGYENIKQWLVSAGVRWGLDKEHRKSLGMPAYGESSWEFGLDRLFAGYAMQVEEPEAMDSLLTLSRSGELQALDVIEGMNANHFDSFLVYWQRLLHWRAALNYATTAGEWALRLHQLLEDFYLPEEEEIRSLNAVHQQISVLEQVNQQQWYGENIPLSVIQDVIKPVLQQADHARHHWREGIKFCSLLPMRGVPFKVVYVLGMNLNDYPRRVERKGFDLMRKDHRPGDRASRTDDRWLFLEALLSARQFFHVSYCGRDMYRNENSEPSVVLAELMDYICHDYEIEKLNLVTRHALQPFGEDYFLKKGKDSSSQYVSFNAQALLIAQAKQHRFAVKPIHSRWQAQGSEFSDDISSIDLDEFVRFFTKPWNWFFKYRHKLRLRIEEDQVSDEEIYTLSGGLESWELRQSLITRINQLEGLISEDQYQSVLSAQTDELIRLWKAQGRWPVGMAGEKARKKLLDHKYPAYFFASQGKQILAQSFRLPLQTPQGTLVIRGDITLRDNQYLLHSASKNSADKLLEFYIRYMAMLCSEAGMGITGARAVFAEGKKPFDAEVIVPLEKVDTVQAKNWLRDLASLYLQYRDTGLPFHPALGYELQRIAEQDRADKEDVIDELWYSDSYFKKGLIKDIEARSYFVSVEALKEEVFEACCRQIWSLPL